MIGPRSWRAPGDMHQAVFHARHKKVVASDMKLATTWYG